MSEDLYDAGVVLLWLSGAVIVGVVVSLVAIAWASRERGGFWTGDE